MSVNKNQAENVFLRNSHLNVAEEVLRKRDALFKKFNSSS